MTDPLPVLLDRYYHDTLLEIAAFNDLPTADSSGRKLRKDTLIEMLCHRLYVPQQARESLPQLNAVQHMVLERILLHGGEVETLFLRDELEREGIVRPADDVGSQGSSFEEVSVSLIRQGLLLSDGQPQTWNPSAKLDLTPGLRLVIPEPVRQGLPKPSLPSVVWGASTLPAPPVETSISLAQRDLFIYWSQARTQPIPLTHAGLVQKRALRTLNEQLLSPDPALATAANEEQAPRIHFVRLLLQGLQVLVPERVKSRRGGVDAGGIQLVANRQAGQLPEFWEQAVEQRTNACLQVWMQMSDWSELSSLGMSTFDLDLQRARGALLEQLRLLEPGVWLSADRFLSRLSMTVAHLLFQFRRGGRDYPGWDVGPAAPYHSRDYRAPQSDTPAPERYPFASARDRARDTATPSRLSSGRRFAEIEGTFVGGALSGPLHWLGLVDISTDSGRLLAFRISSSGAPVLGIQSSQPLASKPTDPESEARLVVQPNFQVFALGPISEATLARLELFADRVKADRSAFEYTLSRAAIYRGQKAGVSAEQIIRFLEQASGAALPQNVLRTLRDWGAQHERIVFHRAVALCEAASAEMLDAVWAEPAIQSYLQKRLTPTVALVKKGRAQALRDALLQRDLLPALSNSTDRCVGRLQATADGELKPVHEGPDLLLDSCLRRLGEPGPSTPCGVPEQEGRFHITEGAVSHALASGLSLKEYLDQLNALHHGAVPSALQMRIKAWGRYYGRALLQEAVLLEVKDSATADELIADPELAPLLSRFDADPRGRLLVVHTHDLERLHHLLEERGVEVIQQS